MKKLTSLLLAFLIVIGVSAVPVSAADFVSIYLFGEKLEFDVPPQIVNGRTLVPMRKIFETLGATVDWDDDTRTVTAVRADKTISLTIDSYIMYINEEAVALDVAPCIIDSKTMVPARAISESLDLAVDWDADTKSVIITTIADINSELDKKILAKIGDCEITLADYSCNYYVVCAPYLQYELYLGENWLDVDTGLGITLKEKIKQDTKMQIETLSIATVIAKELYGITYKDVSTTAEAQLVELMNSYNTVEEYKNFLVDTKISEKALKKYFEMNEIIKLLMEKFSSDSNYVTDTEIEELLKEEFADKVRVQHILVSAESLDGITPSKTDAEAKAIADEILKKLAKGEDFGKLIDMYNEDPGMTSKNYYTFGEGEMVIEFENASKKLKEGEYTKTAVKSAYGYHIIKRYPIIFTEEDVKSAKDYIALQKLEAMFQDRGQKSPVVWDVTATDNHADTLKVH